MTGGVGLVPGVGAGGVVPGACGFGSTFGGITGLAGGITIGLMPGAGFGVSLAAGGASGFTGFVGSVAGGMAFGVRFFRSDNWVGAGGGGAFSGVAGACARATTFFGTSSLICRGLSVAATGSDCRLTTSLVSALSR